MSVDRLAILGAYPPPYGGVTVHTRRLCALLEEAGVAYRVYNAVSSTEDGQRVVSVSRRRRSWMLNYTLTGRERAVYLMSLHLASWVAGALMASLRHKRVVLRLQSEHLIEWERTSPLRRALARFALRRMTGVVCVSRKLAGVVERFGVDRSRIHWFPGFLPPTPDERGKQHVAREVWEFAEQHQPLLAANGKVDWHRGIDLYSLDHMVELAARLKPDFPRVGIIVCFWEHLPEDQAYLDRLRRRAAELRVSDHILFHTRPGLFLPVIDAADIFLRPTNTDGDANSIREALALGVPVVASDAVERPPGARIFQCRDLADLEVKVRETLSGRAPRDGADPGPIRIAHEDRERQQRYVDFLARLAGGV